MKLHITCQVFNLRMVTALVNAIATHEVSCEVVVDYLKHTISCTKQPCQ